MNPSIGGPPLSLFEDGEKMVGSRGRPVINGGSRTVANALGIEGCDKSAV